MMRVYLALDWSCISPAKIAADELGGTERRMITLQKHLQAAGHEVVSSPNPGPETYDVAVHSNAFQSGIEARKHVLWAGSWHADPSQYPFDTVVFVSEFMKSKYNYPDAEVVSASYNDNVLEYKRKSHIHHRIVCTSNPNRWLNHGISVAQKLRHKRVNFHIDYSGGNKLYGAHFPESVNLGPRPRMVYHGVLRREVMLRLLASAHVWAYPCFSSGDETFCMAAVEAIALGIPVVVPEKQPFLEVLGDAAFYAKDEDDFVDKICRVFYSELRNQHDVSRYSETVVMGRFIDILEALAAS